MGFGLERIHGLPTLSFRPLEFLRAGNGYNFGFTCKAYNRDHFLATLLTEWKEATIKHQTSLCFGFKY